MRKLLAALLLALSLVPAAATQKTTSQLTTDNTTNFPDNRTGAITPAILRAFHKDVIDSYVSIYTITGAAPSNNWVNGFDSAGAPTFAQPLFTNLGGSLGCSQLPTLSGDVSSLLCATTIGNNVVTNAKAAQMAANTIKGNATGSTANASDLAMPSCSGAGQAVNWTSGTGPGCVTIATSDLTAPGPIGSVTPNTGAFTTLSASSTVSGAGFSTWLSTSLASPPAIGGTTPAGALFTTLSASSTVSGAGFSTYLASPPAIGGTAPAAGAFTTLSASSTVSGAGFSTYLASPPAIGGTTPAAGSFTTGTFSNLVTFATGTTSIAAYKIPAGTLKTSPVAGDAEFDGSAFYKTINDSNRGVDLVENFVFLTSTRTFTSNTSAQAIFAGGGGPTNGRITLPVGSYQFDMMLNLASFSASSHTLAITFNGGTSTVSAMGGLAIDLVTGPYTISSSSGFTTIAGTQTTGQINASGFFRISVAGTFLPQLTQGTNTAAGTVLSGSYIRIRQIGSTSVNYVGAWD